jgi:hypothetical protein
MDPDEASSRGSANHGACSRIGWRVPAVGTRGGGLSVPTFCSSDVVKRQQNLLGGLARLKGSCVWELLISPSRNRIAQVSR